MSINNDKIMLKLIWYENISLVASIKITRIFIFRFQLEASENKQFFFLNQVHGLPQFYLGTQIKNFWLRRKYKNKFWSQSFML